MQYTYEPATFIAGWFDAESGLMFPSWWDRDLASDNGAVIPLVIAEPIFFDDPDDFLVMPPITYEVTVNDIFLDDDVFFHPMAIRALGPPDQMLRNEIKRIR